MERVTPSAYVGPTPGSPEQVHFIIEELRRLYPDAKCSLNFTTPLELLIATQLAAQCTDERVNAVTAQLFRKYHSPADYVSVSLEELEQDVKPTGFYRNKAKNIQLTCQRLLSTYGGEVPKKMADLLSLPGVARKTANVVQGSAFGIVEGFVVDTHGGRLARRFGWTTSEDPIKVEQDLMRIVPREDWVKLSHLLIYHGRAICQSRRPVCEQCTLAKHCPSAFLVAH